MEEWYAVINTYEKADGNNFLKTCHAVQAVLDDDLSLTEIDWFVDTLLLEPVNLLKTVASKRSETDGHHGISLAFKLLSKLITKHPDVVSQHFDSIVNLCELTYDSKSKPHAMRCLTSVVPHFEPGAADYMDYVRLLDNDKNCKAPIAELVGAICEHHRDLVAEDVPAIWRVYLNLLDSGLSDTVKKSLLIGVLGVLKSFGPQLSTSELNVFYGLLVPLKDIDKCKEGFLKVLEHHSGLFPERLAEDEGTRDAVWSLLRVGRFKMARNAILSMYDAIFSVQDEEDVQRIMSGEVLPRTRELVALVSLTALRVLRAHDNAAPPLLVDAPDLEFKMRRSRLSQEDLETILWCVESNVPEKEELLKASLLYYKSINKEYRDKIPVQGLLDSPKELRKCLVALLAKESWRSLREQDSEYLGLWRSIFRADEEGSVEREGLFEDYLECLADALQSHLVADGEEETSETLKWILKTSAAIIPLANGLNGGAERCVTVLRLLKELEQAEKGLEGRFVAARPLLQRLEGRRLDGCRMEFSKEECRGDDALLEGCLATLLAPVSNAQEAAKGLHALQIVLSEIGLEPNLLSGALSALETLIIKWEDDLDKRKLIQVIRQVMTLQQRAEYKGKDGRELRRNTIMFLGKYARGIQLEESHHDATYHLGNALALKILNLSDDSLNKINLQEVFRLALELEDPKAIRPLLELLRANSSERSLTAQEERAICSSTYALACARSPLNMHLLDACSDAAAGTLLQLLGFERRPSVRGALCDVLGRLSLSHRHREDHIVRELRNHAQSFLANDSTKPAGVDVSAVLLDVLEHQNSLAKEVLPSVITQIARTRLLYALDTLKKAMELFLDKIELFEEIETRGLIKDLLEALIGEKCKGTVQASRSGDGIQNGDATHEMADLRLLKAFTSSTVHFINVICERKSIDLSVILEDVLLIEDKVNFRVFYTLSVVRREFCLDGEECRKIVAGVVKTLFGFEQGTWDLLRLEGVLAFCSEYMKVLLELHHENTVNLLSAIILGLQPRQIVVQEKKLATCFRNIFTLLGAEPRVVDSLQKWCLQLPLDDVTDNLLKQNYPENDAVLIHSLGDALNIYGVTDPAFASLGVRSQQWLNIIKKHTISGYFNYRISNLDYCNDLLRICFRLNEHEVRNVLKDYTGDFSERSMPALFEYLVKKPFILVEEQFEKKCPLLNAIVKECARRKDYEHSNILDLVNEMWPTYELKTDFDTKLSLLLEMASFPRKLAPDSNPMRWVKSCIRSESLSPTAKAKLVWVIPPEEAYMAMWRRLAGLLPARPSEVSGGLASLFKALLAALPSNNALLGCLAPLLAAAHADGEEYGWCEEAVDACISSLAAKGGLEAANDLYRKSAQDPHSKVCTRLLVPLLSRCSCVVCEEFFSEIAIELVSTLQRAPRATTPHHVYHRAVAEYSRALQLLTVAFEKIPRARVMSPRSLLYKRMRGVNEKSFHLAKIVAKSCANLVEMKVVQCPEDADRRLRDACLLFHCENYNCLSSAIGCWAPDEERIYGLVFNLESWLRIVDPDEEYELPIRAHTQRWREVGGGVGDTGTPPTRSNRTLTRTRTRTRTFLDTLSENPVHFDLEPHAEEQEVYTEEKWPEVGLNSHSCAKQLTSAVKFASKRNHFSWLKTLAEGLTSAGNVGWLLAQVICNCREDLKGLASHLRPALLEMIVKTSEQEDLLNGLHLDVLDAIVYWQEDANSLPAESIANLDAIVTKLISTCEWHSQRKLTIDALLGRLDPLMELYGSVLTVDWRCLSEFVNVTSKDTARTYFDILKCITRRHVRVPHMFTSLMDTLGGERGSERVECVARVGRLGQLGKALGQAAAREGAGEGLARVRSFLERRKGDMQQYIELLQGIQAELPSVCDMALFRSLVGLASRTVERTRAKVLNILVTHIRNHTEDYSEVLEGIRILEMVGKGDEAAIKLAEEALYAFAEPLRTQLVVECMKLYESGKVPKTAIGVLLKAFEGLMRPVGGEPNPKRVSKPSPLLGQWAFPMATLGLALAEKKNTDERNRAARALPSCDNPQSRFTEAFMLCVYLPMMHYPAKCSSANFWALLDMYFAGLRGNSALKQPLRHSIAEATSQPSSVHIGESKPQSDEDNTEEARSVEDVLNAVLHFTERSVEASTAVWLQLASALWRRGAGFEPATLLTPLLSKGPAWPLLMAARLFVDDCCAADGFKESVSALAKSSKEDEDRDLILLLQEDVLLRTSGMEYFSLGKSEEGGMEDVEMVDPDQKFSLKDLVSSFGRLSNWEQLTVQQRVSVERRLPPLWADLATFHTQFELWRDDSPSGGSSEGDWLSKMASAYRPESRQGVRWLNNLKLGGKVTFASAATGEAAALERTADEATVTVPHFLCDIRPEDCLAEWSARLMLRSVCLKALLGDADSEKREVESELRSLSLSHALRWCKSANERAIPAQVLSCLRTVDKDDRRCLGWLNEELKALRSLALKTANTEGLPEILKRSEIESVSYLESATIGEYIETNKLQLQLYTDAKCLSKEKLQHMLNATRERCMQNYKSLGSGNRKVLESVVLMAFTHYDAQWDAVSASHEHDSLLMDMTKTLDMALELNLGLRYPMLVDVLLSRMNHDGLSEEALNVLADKLYAIGHFLDDFALEAMKTNPVLSSRLLNKLQSEESSVEEFRKCLPLIADPEHSLKQYCSELYSAAEKEDPVAWANAFRRMKGKIFENPWSGPDYKVLGKHQSALYSLEDFDPTKKESTKQILLRIIKELTSHKETLRLSQLCPFLSRYAGTSASATERLSRLLMLPTNGSLYKFEEQVEVFTRSARRPAVLGLRLRDGRRRRLMLKCGESLRRDAAAVRLSDVLPKLGRTRTHYSVRPLNEESGLIEFLEDHEMLRKMISSRYAIDGLCSSLAEEEETKMDLGECLSRFKLNCDKIPAHSLRTVMELRCASVEEFLSKKRRFQDSLGDATFSSWILGLGDRHLDNMMYSHLDGSLVLVDWNPVLRHGKLELPPARLTRALLAPCDFTVLESHLQRLATEGRENHRLLLAVLKVSFQWMGREFEHSMADVSDSLSGRALPHQVSLRGLGKGPSRGAKRATQVLNEAFELFEEKDGYSVTEQVSNLLRHCTDPRILSITRSRWEPWL